MNSNSRVIFYGVYVPQLPYPFICWWASRLLPCPGYYKQCCDEHWGDNSLVFNIFRVVRPSPLSNYKTFLSLQKETPYPLAVTSFPHPLTQPVAPTSVLSDYGLIYSRLSMCGIMQSVLFSSVQSLDHVRLFASLWTQSYQVPLSMVFFQARVLEWVAISFSRGFSQSRDQTSISCIAGGWFVIWATRGYFT